MKTILVTGGTGFIGSHLCERLLKEGDHVICVDNFLTSSKDNVKHLLANSHFKLLKHDIITPLFLDENIAELYNLACPASPLHYQKNAVRTVKANTIGLINMLGLAKAKKAKILQTSTSEIYGDPEVHPQPEDYRGNVNCVGPRACYDEGKRCSETLCFDYYRMHGLRIKVVRIFNTYGPRLAKDDGRVVSNFILQALQGQDLTIYGDGSQTRSFCYIDDMVDGLIAMMRTDDDIMGPINLGNPDEFTIKELAEKVIAFTGSKSSMVYKKLPQDDPRQRRPDITKAKQVLKWQPEIKLEDGLVKTINYFKTVIY